jgi:hypothetical protein
LINDFTEVEVVEYECLDDNGQLEFNPGESPISFCINDAGLDLLKQCLDEYN